MIHFSDFDISGLLPTYALVHTVGKAFHKVVDNFLRKGRTVGEIRTLADII